MKELLLSRNYFSHFSFATGLYLGLRGGLGLQHSSEEVVELRFVYLCSHSSSNFAAFCQLVNLLRNPTFVTSVPQAFVLSYT
jgi:hypothetical protein